MRRSWMGRHAQSQVSHIFHRHVSLRFSRPKTGSISTASTSASAACAADLSSTHRPRSRSTRRSRLLASPMPYSSTRTMASAMSKRWQSGDGPGVREARKMPPCGETSISSCFRVLTQMRFLRPVSCPLSLHACKSQLLIPSRLPTISSSG